MRTVLAPLHLHGVGTPAVESLASFFCRLADVHQVSPRQLGKVVCNDSQYLRFSSGPELSHVDLYPAMFCSYSTQTEILVHRLQKLTGAQNLVCGTLLKLRHVLSANQVGACARKRRWCPACYARCEEHVVVEPLAWSIVVMCRCSVHRVLLQDRCPRCWSYQPNWRFGSERKVCNQCDAPLTVVNSTDPAPTPWEIWRDAQMLRLIGHFAAPDAQDAIPDALPKFINVAATISKSNGVARCAAGQQFRWERNQRHCLGSIFPIAARWGTTPLDILLRPEEAATPNLFQSYVDPPASPVNRRYNKNGYHRCERTLQRLLRLPPATPLPALRDICRECVISNATFRDNNLELCKRYGAERRRRNEAAKAKRVVVANRYAAKLLRDLCASGKRLHRKHAVAAMMRDIHASKAVARSALRVAVARMSVERKMISR